MPALPATTAPRRPSALATTRDSDEPSGRAGEEGRPPAGEAVLSAEGTTIGARSIVWPVLLSLLTLGVVGYFTFDLEAFVQVMRGLDPWWLAVAVATVGVRVVFGGWRLNYFSRGRLGLRASVR